MPRLTFEYKITVANVIQIALIVLGGAGMWFTLVGNVSRTSEDLAAMKPIVGSLQVDSAAFNTRLTVVESRAETQSKAMDKLSDSIEQLGTTVQGLAVTSATVKTDVGYVRDFIETMKRQTRASIP